MWSKSSATSSSSPGWNSSWRVTILTQWKRSSVRPSQIRQETGLPESVSSVAGVMGAVYHCTRSLLRRGWWWYFKSGTYCFIFTDAVACRTHMYKITMWSASYIQIYQLGVPEPEQSQELPARSHCKVGIIFLCNVREEKARNFMCEFDSVHTSLSEMPMYMYSVSM